MIAAMSSPRIKWTPLLPLLALVVAFAPLAPRDAHAQGMPGTGVGEAQADPAGESTGEAPAAVVTPEARATPRAMVENFVRAYHAWKRDPGNDALKSHFLSFLPSEQRSALDNAGLRDATRLAEVFVEFNREGDGWAASLPNEASVPELADGTLPRNVRSGGHRLPLYFERDQADLSWRFAPASIESATRVHLEMFPEQHRLKRLFVGMGMAGLTTSGFLGLLYYQWISLFGAIFLGVVLDFIVRGIVHIIARRYLKREDDVSTPSDTSKLITRAGRPFGLVASATLVYFLLPVIDMPAQAEGILRAAARIVGMIAGLMASFRVVDLAAEFFARRAAGTSTKMDDLLIPLVRKAVKVFLFAFGLVFIADALNLPIASLVAGFSIAGAAIAFASKDTIENLFGSVAVILDRPFVVGDWVVVGDVEGTVEELGFRSTRIRTFYNSLVTVPNATLVRAQVDNYGRRRFRRFKTMLNLDYATPPDRIEAFCEGIRMLIAKHPHTRKDFYEVHLNSFGAHSLDVLVYMFFRTGDWSEELRERHRFMLDILRLAKRLGVSFAFPTQTVHMLRGERPGAPMEGAVERLPEPESKGVGRAATDDVLARADWIEGRS